MLLNNESHTIAVLKLENRFVCFVIGICFGFCCYWTHSLRICQDAHLVCKRLRSNRREEISRMETNRTESKWIIQRKICDTILKAKHVSLSCAICHRHHSQPPTIWHLASPLSSCESEMVLFAVHGLLNAAASFLQPRFTHNFIQQNWYTHTHNCTNSALVCMLAKVAEEIILSTQEYLFGGS